MDTHRRIGRQGDSTMSIRTRALSDGSKRYDVDEVVGTKPDGSPDRKKRSCRTMSEAKAVQARFVAMREATRGRSSGITLADYVSRFVQPRIDRLEATSRDTYRRELRLRILPALGRMQVRDITRQDAQALADACGTRPVARKCIGLLHKVMADAVADGVAPSNPVASVALPKGGAKRDGGTVVTTFAEIEPILDAVSAHGDASVKAVAFLGFLMGLRPEERYGLDCSDADAGAGVLHVRSAYVSASAAEGGNQRKCTKTPLSTRDLPLMGRALDAVEEARGGRDGGPLIVGAGGGRISPSTAQKRWRRFMAEHGDGLPFVTIENMRHSFATSYLHAGGNVEDLSRILGHSDINTTYRRYVKPSADDLRRGLAAALGEAL